MIHARLVNNDESNVGDCVGETMERIKEQKLVNELQTNILQDTTKPDFFK